MELLSTEIRDQVRSILEWPVPPGARRVIEIEPEAAVEKVTVLLFFGRAYGLQRIDLEWDAEEIDRRLVTLLEMVKGQAEAIDWHPAGTARGGDDA